MIWYTSCSNYTGNVTRDAALVHASYLSAEADMGLAFSICESSSYYLYCWCRIATQRISSTAFASSSETRNRLQNNTICSATAEIARDTDDEPWNGHSVWLRVVRFYASRRRIYDFLLALSSNLTSIFNRSRDINYT